MDSYDHQHPEKYDIKKMVLRNKNSKFETVVKTTKNHCTVFSKMVGQFPDNKVKESAESHDRFVLKRHILKRGNVILNANIGCYLASYIVYVHRDVLQHISE